MVSASALAERGRGQIPSVVETHQLESGVEQGVSASEADDLADPGRFVLHTRTTGEIRPAGAIREIRPAGAIREILSRAHDTEHSRVSNERHAG